MNLINHNNNMSVQVIKEKFVETPRRKDSKRNRFLKSQIVLVIGDQATNLLLEQYVRKLCDYNDHRIWI